MLNIKSKFAMISTDLTISITDITWIQHNHFLKIKKTVLSLLRKIKHIILLHK